jgi:hypothetical protein
MHVLSYVLFNDANPPPCRWTCFTDVYHARLEWQHHFVACAVRIWRHFIFEITLIIPYGLCILCLCTQWSVVWSARLVRQTMHTNQQINCGNHVLTCIKCPGGVCNYSQVCTIIRVIPVCIVTRSRCVAYIRPTFYFYDCFNDVIVYKSTKLILLCIRGCCRCVFLFM